MDKNSILNRISEKEIFFKYLNITDYPKGNIKSPFSEDKNPSFKLYPNNTFKCHSTGFQGDCWQFVADLKNINCKQDFNLVLEEIADEFNIDDNRKLFKYTTSPLSDLHTKYYSQGNWNVSKKILEKYNVLGLDKFEFFNSKKGEISQIKLFKGVFGFTYMVDSNAELYIPKQPNTKKFFYNNLSQDAIFGFEQLAPQNDFIIISAGKKDCLILNANGFPAVAFRSENHYLKKEQFQLLKTKGKQLFCCYDNDKSGRKFASQLKENYGIESLRLPKEYNDVADYFIENNAHDFTSILTEVQEISSRNTKDVYTVFDEIEAYISERFELRFNEIALEIEAREKGNFDWVPLNENTLFIQLRRAGIKCNINDLIMLLKSDFIDRYNPLEYYFNSIKYNGKENIKKLCSYVKTDDDQQFYYHLKKWLVRAVKCVFEEDYFNKQAFILVHKGQSSGKSTFCRFLCPPALKKYIAEDISNDKDARILLCKNLLINLDELYALSKKEINSLKSYFSKTVVNERLPYDRKNTILPRVCSFVGSTNMSTFLEDETGSVRWLCFELLGKINFAYSKEVDIAQVWAEAVNLYRSNFDCELSIEDLKTNEARNKKYTTMSSEAELIVKHFRPANAGENATFMTSTDIECYLSVSRIRISKVGIGKAMTMLGYERYKNAKKQVYGYDVIITNPINTIMDKSGYSQ